MIYQISMWWADKVFKCCLILTGCQQSENTSLGGSITVRLTPCLYCLDTAVLLMLQQFYVDRQIQTNQTGNQPFSDTSPYSECSIYKFVFKK